MNLDFRFLRCLLGHHWIQYNENITARCCPDCGCGKIKIVRGGVYGPDWIFIVKGKTCRHAT